MNCCFSSPCEPPGEELNDGSEEPGPGGGGFRLEVLRFLKVPTTTRGWQFPAIAFVWLVFAVFAAPAGAEEGRPASLWSGSYAGISAGIGRFSNRIRDIDGFSDWGNPGSTNGYDDGGAVGGVFWGRRFAFRGVGLRYEVEAMLGDLSARTDGLDPTCPDEAAEARLRWALAARFGAEKEIGDSRVFALAGPALGRIVNAVIDTDYSGSSCLERDLRFDADDSFRSESTRLGWSLGLGVETALAPRWTLRFEGVYFDFGEESYRVNHSRNNSCGPGGPRAPCTFEVDNRITALRLAIVYRFDR